MPRKLLDAGPTREITSLDYSLANFVWLVLARSVDRMCAGEGRELRLEVLEGAKQLGLSAEFFSPMI